MSETARTDEASEADGAGEAEPSTPVVPSPPAKPPAPLAATIAAIVALLVFLGWQVYIYFLAPPRRPPLDPVQQKARDGVAVIVRRTGGDMGKMTPEERAELNRLVPRFGGMAYADVKREIYGGE